MSKFSWVKKKVNGKDQFQVMIGGHPHGNPCRNEEEANAFVALLEQEELQREIERKKAPVPPEKPAPEKAKRKIPTPSSFDY